MPCSMQVGNFVRAGVRVTREEREEVPGPSEFTGEPGRGSHCTAYSRSLKLFANLLGETRGIQWSQAEATVKRCGFFEICISLVRNI